MAAAPAIEEIGVGASLDSAVEGQARGFNIYEIVVTAVVFFIVLVWYNVALAIYNYFLGTPPSGSDIPKINLDDQDGGNIYYNDTSSTVLDTIGYAVFWTLLAAAIYVVVSYYIPGISGDPRRRPGHPSFNS